ncbi:MAG: RES family NAD+ phosphorylase [Nitrospinae bacterium]|nr:RES family NAD+ phosphorylase [Nitrospinota bacterium]
MSIRIPPSALAEPNLVTLEAGALVHRVHDRNYGAVDFNPCRGSPTRFAPVYDAAGACVPSLYAADTLEAAIHETIFHDVPVTAKRKTVPRTLAQSRAHARLEVLRDLRLASLRGPDLKRWRIGRSSLIGASPKPKPPDGRAPYTTSFPKSMACSGPRTSAIRTPHTCSSETASRRRISES